MASVDESILEYLSEHETGSPTQMMEDAGLPYSPSHISMRCSVLADKGMIQPLGRGVYRITERGEDFLAGEFDARTLDDENGQTEASA